MAEEKKAQHVWMCTYCGTPYETEKQAEQCWESHSDLTFEPIWGGIGSGTDMPAEVVIKKHERGFITEIATYVLDNRKKVRMRERSKIGE